MTPDGVLMVRPKHFGFNPETAASNAFQKQAEIADAQSKALAEFDAMTNQLQEAGIEVIIASDQEQVVCPDAIFPNNWFCHLPNGKLVLFPMLAENRRKEVNLKVTDSLLQKTKISGTIDYSNRAVQNQFLEGTGSIIFDHQNRLAYACESPRTDLKLLQEFCVEIGYRAITFLATDAAGQAIYHTNVLMGIGEITAIICSESITDQLERSMLLASLKKTEKTLVDITFSQMNSFAGNAFEVKSTKGNIWILSSTAWNSLTESQQQTLGGKEKSCVVNIPTIEKLGGGSARCMMAGWFAG